MASPQRIHTHRLKLARQPFHALAAVCQLLLRTLCTLLRGDAFLLVCLCKRLQVLPLLAFLLQLGEVVRRRDDGVLPGEFPAELVGLLLERPYLLHLQLGAFFRAIQLLAQALQLMVALGQPFCGGEPCNRLASAASMLETRTAWRPQRTLVVELAGRQLVRELADERRIVGHPGQRPSC